jgi:transposase-like protein
VTSTPMSDPIVEVASMADVFGVWSLRVRCPHCGSTHLHEGGPSDRPPTLGRRAAHCLRGGWYTLTDARYLTSSTTPS